MDFFKGVWNKIKTPHGVWLVLFYIFSALLIGGTLALVILQSEQTVWHYILYVFSVVALTYFVYTIVYFTPKIKNKIIQVLRKYKFTSTMLDNYGYRTIIFSIFSFVCNFAYMIFMLVFGILTGSAWYLSITAYYLVLRLVKGMVLFSKKKNKSSEMKKAKAYKFCGIMFLLLTFAFSGIIVLIYTSNMYFEYAGLMIYAVASYTFLRLTIAIVNMFKARKQEDLYVECIGNINLTSALISLVVLQVAMFQAFSPENQTSIANGLTGAGVSLVILFLGVLSIIKGNKLLKTTGDKNEKQK